MSDLMTMLPIFLFMLIPVWIPLATMAVGAIADAVKAPARLGSRVASRDQAVTPAGRRVPAAGIAR